MSKEVRMIGAGAWTTPIANIKTRHMARQNLAISSRQWSYQINPFIGVTSKFYWHGSNRIGLRVYLKRKKSPPTRVDFDEIKELLYD